MKKAAIWLMLVLSISLVNCKKEEGLITYNIQDGSGTSIMSNVTGPSGITSFISLYFVNNTFTINDNAFGCDANPEISDVGKKRNSKRIKDIPSSGWGNSMAAQDGHGYVVRYKNQSGGYNYAKFLVTHMTSYLSVTVEVKDPF